MRPLAREEIAPLAPYGAVRDAFRRAVIAHKRSRRLPVGPSVTLVFEDRETLRFQVQEMLWVERIEDPERVQHELDVYNELMPGPGELSATLFVEITEPGRIRAELDRLIGIDEHVSLRLGAGADEQRIPARFDAKQFEEDRISAVQYVRFALDAEQAARLADPARPARVSIAHPAYSHTAELPPALRASLAAGLSDEPASLLPALPDGAAPAPREPETLFESANARVLRPAGEDPDGMLVVEARGTWPATGEPDAARWAELHEALRRAAREVIARGGGCRVVADLAPGAPLRWLVLPRREGG